MSCVALSPAPAKRPIRVLPLTQEERDEIASMLADGKSAGAIVEWIGCTVAQVRAQMRDPGSSWNAGKPAPPPRDTPVRADCRCREDRLLERLARGPATSLELMGVLRITIGAVDNMARRLAKEGRVVRLSGGRHMPSGQKACLWALPEGEG